VIDLPHAYQSTSWHAWLFVKPPPVTTTQPPVTTALLACTPATLGENTWVAVVTQIIEGFQQAIGIAPTKGQLDQQLAHDCAQAGANYEGGADDNPSDYCTPLNGFCVPWQYGYASWEANQ
jgi:hypothetical protein